MKKLKVTLIILLSLTVFIFFCRLDYTRIIFNDYVLNICDATEQERKERKLFTAIPKDKTDWYYGLYALEFCSVHRGRDNTVYLVRLKDASTGKIYKTALAKDVVEFGEWFLSSVVTNIGDGGIYFCLPRKNDLNKAIIEKRTGMAFEQFLKKQYRSDCI